MRDGWCGRVSNQIRVIKDGRGGEERMGGGVGGEYRGSIEDGPEGRLLRLWGAVCAAAQIKSEREIKYRAAGKIEEREREIHFVIAVEAGYALLYP